MAVGAGGVWVANRRAQTLTRIDPERAVVTDRFPLGSEPRALAVVDGRLWVAVAAAGEGHRGGTLRVAFQGEPFDKSGAALLRAEFDPATSYSEFSTLLSLTSDGLTALRRVGGTAGLELVPDLAEAIPTPSDGGRTYTFTVRNGVRFSTGGRVRPSDIKRGIERSLNAKQAAFGVLDGIKSIAADDANRTIVIRLRRPDPDFPYRLALPFASPVPPGTAPPPSRRGGHGALPDHAIRPSRACPSRAQPLLPDVVHTREAGRLSGRDRHPAGRQRSARASRPSAPVARM